jgi:hypothetical protein
MEMAMSCIICRDTYIYYFFICNRVVCCNNVLDRDLSKRVRKNEYIGGRGKSGPASVVRGYNRGKGKTGNGRSAKKAI